MDPAMEPIPAPIPEWNGMERRNRKRYGIRGSTIQYRKGGLLAALAPVSARYLLLNVSETGCNFITKDPLSAGQPLSLTVACPNLDSPIGGHGRVTWVRKSPEFDAFHVGVEFTKMAPAARAALRSVLDTAVLEKVEITTRIFLKEIEKL